MFFFVMAHRPEYAPQSQINADRSFVLQIMLLLSGCLFGDHLVFKTIFHSPTAE
jgi:hypothetical protein|tara:strand:+ start:1696 stop:1857 length:162 start_codon:yes stop_codon:yes gene_type:complete